ncbi:MAG: MMPL family transporter [Vicinamibacterales bacterium]
MAAVIEAIISWAHRRRVVVLVATLAIVAVSMAGMCGLRFDADVLRLLPRAGSAVGAFRVYLERFGTIDDLYVVFSAPEGQMVSEYEDQIDAWVESLAAAPEIRGIEQGRIDASRDWNWLGDHELLLMDQEHLTSALQRLTPGGMAPALASSRDLLAAPSPDVTAMVQTDPLGFHDLLRRQMLTHPFGSMLTANGDGFVTADGRRRLVIARPARPPYDTEFSHQLLDRLQSIERLQSAAGVRMDPDLPPLDVQFAGGHRIATEAEAVIKRESMVNGIGSLALILPLLWLVFRSTRLLIIGALPSALSIIIVLDALGFAGMTLSAAAAGSAAMLFGLGVDGVVLLYVTHRLAAVDTPDASPGIAPLAGPAASMMLGMWTTGVMFLALMIVDFPSLEQLGLLIGASMMVCGVTTLVLVPAALPKRPRVTKSHDVRMPRFAAVVIGRSRTILTAAIVVTVVLGGGLFRLRLDPTLNRLRSVTPGAVMLDEVIRSFALPTNVTVILQEGGDIDPLLEANETLVTALRDELPTLAVQAPSALLPSQRTQQARAALVRAGTPSADRFRADFTKAAEQGGLVAAALAPFLERLERLRAADPLTYDTLKAHGIDDIDKSVARVGDRWTLATYAFPQRDSDLATLLAVVNGHEGMVATGIDLVNRELGEHFMPQFVKGIAVGSAIVVAMMLLTFHDWGYVLLALTPTAIGLIWAGGLLGFAGIELDLFAVFAVMTFVGIGVDYGIHLIHRYREQGNALTVTTELAPVILVAGAITLLGYGTLIASSYPPLRSIGLVSVVSVVGMVIASVLVLPALLHWSER